MQFCENMETLGNWMEKHFERLNFMVYYRH